MTLSSPLSSIYGKRVCLDHFHSSIFPEIILLTKPKCTKTCSNGRMYIPLISLQVNYFTHYFFYLHLYTILIVWYGAPTFYFFLKLMSFLHALLHLLPFPKSLLQLFLSFAYSSMTHSLVLPHFHPSILLFSANTHACMHARTHAHTQAHKQTHKHTPTHTAGLICTSISS